MNARNSLKSLAVSSDSESEVEPFITQTKAASVAVLQLSFRKTILNLHLRVQTTSKQLTISIFAPKIFRPTCMFRDKEDCWRGISTRKFSRGVKQEYQKTRRGQLHVCMEYASLGWLVKERNTFSLTATLSWNRRILKTLFNFGLSFWLWKSMNQQQRKSVSVAQKKRSV